MTNILKLNEPEMVIKTGNTCKINIGGKSESHPVYKVDLDLLYYNEYNDRIATDILNYYSNPANKSLDRMSLPERNKKMQEFVYNSNVEKIVITKNNIVAVGQMVPGVVLSDGRVIDGNRRFTCLRVLREEHPTDPKYRYFETVILDLDITNDKKQIKALELALQHGTDEKVEYNLIDNVIGTYNTIVRDKTLTIPEYGKYANEKDTEIKKRIEIAELMNEYLAYLGMEGQYGYLKKTQAYSLFVEMIRPLNNCKSDKDKEEMKNLIFCNYLVESFVDVKAFLRDLSSVYKDDVVLYNDLVSEQESWMNKINSSLNVTDTSDEIKLRKFINTHTKDKDELKDIYSEKVKEYKIGKIKNGPIETTQKSIDTLRTVDIRMLSTLSDNDKKELKEKLAMLKKRIDSIETALNNKNKA